MTTGWLTNSAAGVLTAVAGLLPLAGEAQGSSTSEPGIVQTGQQVPGLESYDRIIAELMREHRIPGAAVAVARLGRLVYARGFGMADRLHDVPVQPDSLFRIASLSKPITAAAVLKLVEDGQLELDARVFRDLLAGIEPHPPKDARMNEITVRDLLRHSGGFDRDRSGDIPWEQKNVGRKLRKRPPLDCTDIITYMKGQKLDFSPGERFAYSNFGYCALGRVIEKASGMAYEDYVRKEVLVPAGARGMRLSDPFLDGRLENEVKYYHYPGASQSKSFGPKGTKAGAQAPITDSCQRWTHTAGGPPPRSTLLHFVVAVDGRGGDDILAEETIELMIERPDYARDVVWYGLGWLVRDLGKW